MNRSREVLGSGNKSNGDSGKVTSGNTNFDRLAMNVFRKLILDLCKQKKYDSFQDMVQKVCIKTGRQLPQNLSRWNIHEVDDDSDCEIICLNSTKPLGVTSATPISTSGTDTSTSQSSPLVNPYKKAMTSAPASAEQTKTQYTASTVIKNPYKRIPTVSTPINSKPRTPVVTDTKPRSNTISSSSHSGRINSQPLSQCSNSSYKSPQQQTLVPPRNSVETWTCGTCTYTNTVKTWSRSRRKCSMCGLFPA